MSESGDLTPAQRAVNRYELISLMRFDFDAMPANTHGRVFGVRYVRLDEPEGGQLYVTRYGWRFLDNILPDRWYHNRRYRTVGRRLSRATSAIYRVPTFDLQGRRTDLVARFSRLAQDVPLMIAQEMEREIQPEERYDARFNSPFEEFGRVFQLRRAAGSSEQPRIYTKRPLAIYSPGKRSPIWKLGRKRGQFQIHRRMLAEDQSDDAIHAMFDLDIDRDYIVLYQWVKGIDAEAALQGGLIDEKELGDMTHRVNRELRLRGFKVLDNKPRHFIIRVRPKTGDVMRRHGRIVYALIDFELLQPI